MKTNSKFGYPLGVERNLKNMEARLRILVAGMEEGKWKGKKKAAAKLELKRTRLYIMKELGEELKPKMRQRIENLGVHDVMPHTWKVFTKGESGRLETALFSTPIQESTVSLSKRQLEQEGASMAAACAMILGPAFRNPRDKNPTATMLMQVIGEALVQTGFDLSELTGGKR